MNKELENSAHFWVGWVLLYPLRVVVYLLIGVFIICSVPEEWDKWGNRV